MDPLVDAKAVQTISPLKTVKKKLHTSIFFKHENNNLSPLLFFVVSDMFMSSHAFA